MNESCIPKFGCRVSLKKVEELEGTYRFNDLSVGGKGFAGEIGYTYENREQSLYDYKVSLYCKLLSHSYSFNQAMSELILYSLNDLPVI